MTQVGTLTLADFLLARIAEDEAEVRAIQGRLDKDGDVWLVTGMDSPVGNYDPARVLAECEAKRRIVEAVQATPGAYYGPDYWIGTAASEDILTLLALPYADHPDYREEWRA